MSMDEIFSSADAPGSFLSKKAKIKVVGVGGGGGNAVIHMVEAGIEDVDFVAMNTDAQVLRINKAPYLVQIGEKTSGGMGVGGDPKKGKEAAEESISKMKHVVAGTDLLFITAGMGGGTGTGAAPVLAKLAKDLYGDNILVVGVVTRPFSNEYFVRCKLADEGIKELQKYTDCTIIIPNDRLYETLPAQTHLREAYRKANDVLLSAVKGIADVITKPGEVNIDFNDVKKVLAGSGRALIGMGEGQGPGRHLSALNAALSSPLLESAEIAGAKGFIVHFLSGEELTIAEMNEVLAMVKQYASADSIVMYGNTFDKNFGDKLKLTIIASGFSKESAFLATARKPVFKPEYSPSADIIKAKHQAEKPGFDFAGEDDFLIPAYLRRKKEK